MYILHFWWIHSNAIECEHLCKILKMWFVVTCGLIQLHGISGIIWNIWVNCVHYTDICAPLHWARPLAFCCSGTLHFWRFHFILMFSLARCGFARFTSGLCWMSFIKWQILWNHSRCRPAINNIPQRMNIIRMLMDSGNDVSPCERNLFFSCAPLSFQAIHNPFTISHRRRVQPFKLPWL